MLLKLLSFNIRCTNDPNGHSIAERAPRVAAVLKNYAADIVGFQEYHFLRWCDAWAQVEDPAYGEIKIDRGDGEGLVLWWRKDKFTLLDKGHFWFADDPSVPSTDWDEKYHKPRICGWLLLQDKKTEKTFLYMNVHYGFGAEGQQKNAGLLQRYAKSIGDYPLIIAGDFNMLPGTPGYTAMAEKFTDVNAVTAKLPDITYHGYGEKESMLLDYCFVNEAVTPIGYEIVKTMFDGKYPSDHYPIELQVQL
ncbi:MAG: endonuclease/exonuclease/phosphatase family protein [Oscillospiraceae bacterium]|nr:endonuclease/exonuclease/phosphatase family protein [Oscillospiraceae bacterium]